MTALRRANAEDPMGIALTTTMTGMSEHIAENGRGIDPGTVPETDPDLDLGIVQETEDTAQNIIITSRALLRHTMIMRWSVK